MRRLHCRDAGFDCEGVIEAESTDEVLGLAGQHAKEVHGVDVTPEAMHELLRVDILNIGGNEKDASPGYAQPVGGVIAYEDHVSISGVGFDIGCGNMAVRNERSDLSKTTARWVGASPALVSRRSLLSMAQKPCTAPTGSPSERRVRGGSAW